VFRVYFVSETAQVEPISGRVYAPGAGSSGQPICPDLAIVDDAGNKVPNGCVAHIVVKVGRCRLSRWNQ